MARTAQDVRLLFSVLAGYDIEDPFSAPVPLRIPRMDGLRVGVWSDMFGGRFQPGIIEAFEKAASVLEEIGIPAVPFQPKDVETAPELWFFFFERIYAGFTKATSAGREAEAHWTGMELTERALQMPAASMEDIVVNLGRRDAMRTSLFQQMEQYPVLLTPVCGAYAFPHRERPFDLLEMMRPVTIFNLLGMPAMVIPFAKSADGMPIGIQLVARAYDEELLLEIACRVGDVYRSSV